MYRNAFFNTNVLIFLGETIYFIFRTKAPALVVVDFCILLKKKKIALNHIILA